MKLKTEIEIEKPPSAISSPVDKGEVGAVKFTG
jgi:hypothetical protein